MLTMIVRNEAVSMPHDLKLVVENLQDNAASAELRDMGAKLRHEFPEAAAAMQERARTLTNRALRRNDRIAALRSASLEHAGGEA